MYKVVSDSYNWFVDGEPVVSFKGDLLPDHNKAEFFTFHGYLERVAEQPELPVDEDEPKPELPVDEDEPKPKRAAKDE